MGERIKLIKEIFFTFLFVVLSLQARSQNLIKGIVIGENNEKLAFAHIVISKDTISTPTYLYTNKGGVFNFKITSNSLINFKVSALGYETKKVSFFSYDLRNLKQLKISLIEKRVTLNEVVIRTKKPLIELKDTIRFRAKFFGKGNEQTVEELLKKIPGLQIDIDGAIKIGNQEIEKLMIDGDDFFGKGYRILSKNMPAYPIEEVEVLKNYSNNRLLNGIEESNKVALNLKLNEKSKYIWFGNIKIGSNFKNRYKLLGNLMNFGKKNKYYFLANINNIGVDAVGEIENLIHPLNFDAIASIGDNQSVRNLLNLSSTTLSFKKQRTNFNKSTLVSLNAIFNPSKKLKIKSLVFLNWDTQYFYRNTIDKVDFNNSQFTNIENYQFKNKKNIGFGKIDFIYNISKTKMFEITTKYNNGGTLGVSDLVFNGISTLQKLQSNNTLFDQKLTYTHKFKSKKVFLLTGRFINEKTPQNYQINQFFYQDLFPSFTNTNKVKQQNNNQMQFIGFEGHLLDRRKNKNLFELQLGNTNRKDKLNTHFSLLKDNTVLNNPINFQNNMVYQTNNLYVKSKYRLKINGFAITGKLGIHQLSNQLFNGSISKKEYSFFINPSIGFSWKMNKKNKISSSFSLKKTNAGILDVYNQFVLTGYRNFSKGTGVFNQLDASSLLINYQLGNWSDRFFANIFVIRSKSFDFFSSNIIIKPNYSKIERIIIKDREFLSVSSKMDYYFKKISSNLKLDIGLSKSNYKNIINHSNLRKIIANNYHYGLELRSSFGGIFNYHIGTKWNTNKIETTTINNSFTNNLTFLDLSFVFNDKFDVQFEIERYFFGNLNKENNTYYFLDFDARYTIKKNKLTLALTGKNLFNTKIFRTFSINDYSSSTAEYKLLPRYILLKMEYQF